MRDLQSTFHTDSIFPQGGPAQRINEGHYGSIQYEYSGFDWGDQVGLDRLRQAWTQISVTGVCEGIIAGLVGITSAAGYVSVWCAVAIGFITAIVISLL